jgi:predicted kinase
MKNRDLILLRGLPGAGKSSLAAALSGNEWPCFSVDDYFTDTVTGEYIFNFENNHLAYKSCLGNTEQAMRNGSEKIFIHNTFTMEWEMEPYFSLAKQHGYRVFVLTVENRHGGTNTHGIGRDQLEKMAEKYRVILL